MWKTLFSNISRLSISCLFNTKKTKILTSIYRNASQFKNSICTSYIRFNDTILVPTKRFPQNQISVTVPQRQPRNHNFSGHLIWERRASQKREARGNKKCSGVRSPRAARPSCFTYFFPVEARAIFTCLSRGERNRKREKRRERGRERDAGAAGQDRDYRRRNRTGNWYPGHEASPSLCVERVTPPLLARRVRSKHPRAVSGTVPSAPSFSTSSAAAQLLLLLLLLRPPSYPSRWMHTRRHGPPITKSMAAPDACIG